MDKGKIRDISEQIYTKNIKETQPGRVFFKALNGDIRIIYDDFLTTNLIENNSVDLIVTSPPYNVDIHYGNFRDDISYEKYLEFTEKWLLKAYSLMKPDGRMCLNIPLDKNKGLYFDVPRFTRNYFTSGIIINHPVYKLMGIFMKFFYIHDKRLYFFS